VNLQLKALRSKNSILPAAFSEQDPPLLQRSRATLSVSWNLVNYCTTVWHSKKFAGDEWLWRSPKVTSINAGLTWLPISLSL